MNAAQVDDVIAVRRLDSAEELAAAAEPEALYVLGLVAGTAHSAWATVDNSAVALVIVPYEQSDEVWLMVMRGPVRSSDWSVQDGLQDDVAADEDGPGESSIHLVDGVRAELGDLLTGLTVPRSAVLGVALERWRATDGADWDMMACYEPPPLQKGESLIRTGLAAAEIQAFLDRVNPHHSVRADDPTVDLWVGIRDGDGGRDGELLAVGALTRRPTGIGYLASIATDPAARGTGYGSAVTAYLTRQVFEAGETCCTLAHYHPNDPARRVYLRLGYRTIAQNYSADFT